MTKLQTECSDFHVIRKHLSQGRNLKILHEFYRFRVLTIEQHSVRLRYTKGSLCHFLARLLKSGLIQSKGIKGYTVNDERKGKYYSVLNKGITFLSDNDYEVPLRAEDIKMSDMRVSYELEVNNLANEFQLIGWSLLSIREVKREYGLNRGDNLHGSLSSPVLKEYPFYLFLNNDRISNRWLNRVVREVNKYGFRNMILLTDGEETFKRVFQAMFSKVEAFTYEQFMLMSLRFGKEYMKHYVDTDLLYDFIRDEVDIVRVEQEAGVDYHTSFELVEFEGDEYYLANMLNNNLANIHHIKQYTREKYMEYGRKLLLLMDIVTNSVIRYEELLETVHYIEYI